MAETLSMVSMVSFVAAGVCLALTVILWFAFRIPNVIGDLSGRNARKSIERMRKSNENTGRKSYRSSALNAARSKLTEAMTERQPRKKKSEKAWDETGILQNPPKQTYTSEATELLTDGETVKLQQDGGATEALDTCREENGIQRRQGVKIRILDEVILVHTEEMIR